MYKHKKKVRVGAILLAVSAALFFLYSTWQQPFFHASGLAPMPTARTEIAGTFFNGKIYVIGGMQAIGKDVADVEAYNLISGDWERAPPLPHKLHHVGATTAGGKLYVIGGFYSVANAFVPVADVYEFDGTLWSKKASMPTARGGLSLAPLDGKIYAVGGHTLTGDTAAVEVYNPKEDIWTKAPPLHVPRGHLSAVIFDGKIYAIGGRDSRKCYTNLSGCSSYLNFNAIEVYDSQTEKWSEIPSPLIARSGAAVAAIGEKFYIFGGESRHEMFHDFEEYDPLTNEVVSLKTDATPRHGGVAIAVDGILYLLGGGIEAAGGATNLAESIPISP